MKKIINITIGFAVSFLFLCFSQPAFAWDSSIAEFWNFDQATSPDQGLIDSSHGVNSQRGHIYQEKFSTGYALRDYYSYFSDEDVSSNPIEISDEGFAYCYWFKKNSSYSVRERILFDDSNFRFMDITIGDNFIYNPPNGSNGCGPGGSNTYIASESQDENWHHYCFSFTQNQGRIYFDEQEVGLCNYNNQVSFVGKNIKRYYKRAENGETGFDDWAIFNRPITAEEVSAIYNAPNGITNTFNFSPPFAIVSPEMNEIKIKESLITVSGNCPTDGVNRIAFTNDCSDFSNLDYTVDCVDNQFSSDFYYNGISDWVVAVEQESIAGDCVDYDDLMDVVEIDGIEVIEGYPDDWHFNYDYYDDYDIVIKSPSFDMPSLTLPLGSENTNMIFSFVYPRPLSPNVEFNIKQYDNGGNLLNGAYHTKALYEMVDTDNYTVSLKASSTPLHYVVQLTDNGNLKRQYPFGVYVSDLDLIINPDEYRYLFPRLVEKMKGKIVFNYYFAFYDGFYNLFSGSMNDVSDDDLDITFKSVSANGEYNLDIPIFKGSNPIVKSFSDGLRPYIVGLLWLGFALYVVVRVNGLFNSDE